MTAGAEKVTLGIRGPENLSVLEWGELLDARATGGASTGCATDAGLELLPEAEGDRASEWIDQVRLVAQRRDAGCVDDP